MPGGTRRRSRDAGDRVPLWGSASVTIDWGAAGPITATSRTPGVKARAAMASLFLFVVALGCSDSPGFVVERPTTPPPIWRPLDGDRATVEGLGREMLEKIGYEEI